MKFNLLKKITLGLASFGMVLALSGGVSSAIPYTGATTPASPVPAYNVFTGNNLSSPMPADGEQDFLQGRVPVGGNLNEGTTPFTDPVNSSCTNGQVIQLHVYIHNGASADGNNNGTGPSVIHGAMLKVALPGSTDKASTFKPSAVLSATNATTVSDNLTINCNGQPVTLQYIPGSASQYSTGTGVVSLSDSIVGNGTSIRSEQTPGDVWGCWDQRIYVVLAVKVVVPPVVTPPTCNLITIDGDNKTVRVTNVDYAAGSAKINKLNLDFGDGAKDYINLNQLPVSHTYSADGTYLVRATLDTSVGNITSDKCTSSITFKGNTKPPVTPPVTPPTTLVNTGPGDVIGIFALVTLVGAVAHRVYTKVLARK